MGMFSALRALSVALVNTLCARINKCAHKSYLRGGGVLAPHIHLKGSHCFNNTLSRQQCNIIKPHLHKVLIYTICVVHIPSAHTCSSVCKDITDKHAHSSTHPFLLILAAFQPSQSSSDWMTITTLPQLNLASESGPTFFFL